MTLVCVVWVLLVCAGMAMVWRYKLTAGTSQAPSSWPVDSVIAPAESGATLVMIAHPRCPCTRATFGELARLLDGARGFTNAHVLFVRPEGTPEGWEQGELWQKASAIPGVVVHADIDGVEARRFGASVSGTTLVYDDHRRLVFQGGITESRGHEGDNVGRQSIVSLLRGTTSSRASSPIFGCDVR